MGRKKAEKLNVEAETPIETAVAAESEAEAADIVADTADAVQVEEQLQISADLKRRTWQLKRSSL